MHEHHWGISIFIHTMRYFGLLTLFVLLVFQSSGQFYSGSYQEFGKNRVQYNQFQWKYQHFERFRLHYYPGEEELATYCAKAFHREMLAIEEYFDFRITEMLDLVVFSTQGKFTQSNIGITRDNSSQVGGMTRVVGTKLFVYYQGTHEQLNVQIRSVLAEVMVRKMLFDGNWKDVLKANSFSTFPEWYVKGFISYMSRPWNAELDARFKEIILLNQPLNFSKFEGEQATLLGHAIWQYIDWNFGKSIIPQILFLTRLTRNPNNGFRGVVNAGIDDLIRLMNTYFLNRYTSELAHQENPGTQKLPFTQKKKRSYEQVALSPNGRYLVYTSHQLGRYWLYIKDLSSGKTRRLYAAEPRIFRESDRTYPVVAWHPQSSALVFALERKGELRLHIHTLEDGKTTRRVVHNMDKILAMNYAPDGKQLILSAVRNGRTNLALYSIQGNSHKSLTDDRWDDLDPSFTQDGKYILFASNRPGDTVSKQKEDVEPYEASYALFLYPVKQMDKHQVTLVRLTDSLHGNCRQPLEIKLGTFAFLSDVNGVNNRYLAQRDSVISSIDTAIHYRQVVQIFPLTNWETSILKHLWHAPDQQYISLIYQNGRYKLIQTSGEFRPQKPLKTVEFLAFSKTGRAIEESRSSEVEGQDTTNELSHVIYREIRLDTNYVKRIVWVGEPSSSPKQVDVALPSTDPLAYKRPREIIYSPDFARDFVVTQLDNQFLSQTYQRFSGPGTSFFNPGLNALMRVGYSDVHEDFKLVGGLRIPLDLRSGEQLIELQFLKKRLDHKLVLYRQSLRQNDALGDEVKWQIHELKHGMAYPFSEVWSLRGTYGYRYDREVVLSRNESSLQRPTTHFHQATGKLELVFDNARELGINLRAGTKLKVFAEYMHQFAPNRSTVNLGFDVRHYQRVVKQLVWVNRFSGATSLGNQRVVYYMGGVDNWLIRPNPHFDSSIDVDPNQPYGYQALASPMRGFLQNSRNGNSFVALNSELRIPVVSSLAKNPVKSEFLRSLQLVTFLDVGTAWTGPHPYSEDNYFNTQVIPGNPITVTLLNNREPFIMGFGTGIRAMLFGYFMKLDCGWGLDSGVVRSRPRLQFSLGWDI